MDSYMSFAKVYDLLMQDVPYEGWTKYLKKILKTYGCHPELVLDLGCGTGSMTLRLAQEGFDMIGLDLSMEMLQVAKEKAAQEEVDILFLNQDMTEMELFGTVGCVVSFCDSLNYILEEEELLEVFRKVDNYLDPGGLYIFDMNTASKFMAMGDNTFAETYDQCAYIWENYYDEAACVNEYLLTLFIEEEGTYKRYEEVHYERAYSIDTVKALLQEAGMEFLAVYEDQSFDIPDEMAERVFFIAREQKKLKELK